MDQKRMSRTATDADRRLCLSRLDRILATELVGMFRDWRHLRAGADIYSREIRRQLEASTGRSALHAGLVARRIVELGGVPDLRMETLPQRSVIDYEGIPGDARDVFLPTLIENDLVAKRIVADAYHEIIDELKMKDPTTCDMLVDIVSAERTHADDLANLLRSVSAGERFTVDA
jgi:bacterioferritin